ncbi:MAG: hypothetical protein IJN22_06055 [Clostridia bacterium]|nr:hypothetical protein [Clostridia bacterium]
MKKILSILVCVCVLLSAMVITASAANTEIVFDFGENKNTTTHADGSDIGTSKSYTNGDYTLALTNVYKCYAPANDAKGTSALKMGTSSVAGNFTITVPDDVTSVIFKVAMYKAKTTAVNINGTEHAITTKSDDGAYTPITVDTTTTKTITFATVDGKCRCMIDSITYVIADTTGGNEPSCEHTAKSAVPNGDETHKLVCDACSETVTPVVDCTDADANGKCDVCEGDVEVSVPDPTPDSTLTIAEAIALGETKEHNTYTDGKYYVVGVVESVYNTQYGNMYIVDEAGNRLTIYGTYDATGENGYAAMEDAPVAGDTVKLYGKIGYYSSAAQMKNAWIVEVTPGETPAPENNDPAAESVLTIEQALALGATKTHNTYTENKYYVTGVITEIYNETYGNMKITDEAGNILTVYGTWDETGEIRFDAMETKPAVGDTVTVYGVIGQYNGTAQMKNGWFKAAPAVDDDDDDTTGGNTTGGDSTTGGATTGGATTGGSTTNNNANTNTNTDNSTTSPDTGDNVGAFAVMAIAAAAVVIAASKKRA